jgi:hypothetical protein
MAIYYRVMRKGLLSILSVVMLSSFLNATPAGATGTLTQGEWTLVYPDFSKLVSDQEWVFEVRANGSNEIGSSDYIDLNIYTSSNVMVAFKSYMHSGPSTKQVKMNLILNKDAISKANINQPLIAKLEIDRSFNSKLKDGSFSFSIPTTTFPKRPSTIGEYVKLNSDFSTPIEFPKSCTDIPFSYTMNDPYQDIDEVNFDIVDSAGESLGSAYSYGYRSETLQGKISLCSYSLEKAVAPFKFQVKVQFESYMNLAPMTAQFPFALSGKFANVENAVSGMSLVCQKGSTYKVAKANCPSGYKKVEFTTPTTIQWNTLTRSANSLKGKKFLVYGCVAQFDTNTGGSKFRAYTLPAPAERYYNGANSLYSGSAKSLLKLSEDDAFAAKVVVSGATTYTTLGGRTSVPSFSIKDFVKIGTC